MEREILKQHILEEIQHYHSKRVKPNLAPIQTHLLKSYKPPVVVTTSIDNSHPSIMSTETSGIAATTTTTTTTTITGATLVRFNETPQQMTG